MVVCRFMVVSLLAVVTVILLASGCGRGQTATYPAKPIDIVVQTAPGSGTDNLFRLVADIIEKEKLSPQPFQIVTKEGGASAVAAAYMLEKKSDAYTIGHFGNTHVMAFLGGHLGNRSIKELTPIALILDEPKVFQVRADSKYKTIQDLVDDAKKRPKQISVGFGSLGSTDHITAFKLAQMLGTEFNYLSFKSQTDAVTQMLGGHLDVTLGMPNDTRALVSGGRARALAVPAEKRLRSLPDVPTLIESGIQMTMTQFRGVSGTPDMPKEAVRFLESTLKKMTETERWRKYVEEDSGSDVVFLNAAEYEKFLEKAVDDLKPLMEPMGLMKQK